jgi:nitrogen fixation protein FixH
MKNKSKLLISAVAVIVMAIAGAGCGTQSTGSGTASDSPAAAVGNDYTLRYEWPEKPKVGHYTLKVNLTDNAGKPVEGAEVVVSYDMPSMRGHHATTETMKQNDRGDYLLPIHFAMPGDWEIVLSAQKDGVEIAAELILLDI